ncbi:plasmid pRiA4b ORF-3 family protein [Nevskia sp.]|uniref:plasmid pRiA4b ORF-3 family protein n=2 Tax=Nevskia sp. TaxID=1929292 RepID=UPI0025CCD62D|nr:plasmid pRiA4b ORF-3 family protein [Nevskia sp.]
MPVERADIPLCEVKITLRDTEPEPWRRVRISAGITLDRLHAVLQRAMGWTDSHLHEFEIRGKRYGMVLNDPIDDDPPADERKVRLIDVVGPKMRFIYRYDFGDGWEHEVKIERVLEPSPELKTPVCLAGEFACPPEDCGGVPGYEDLIAVLAGQDCEEKDEMLTWIGGPFDPLAFDIDAANKRLARLKRGFVNR